MLDAISRCGSRVEFSATTANTTSPGFRYFKPSLREISLQCGGKMEETRTRLVAAIPASRKASSNEVRRSLCLPTPFVMKMRLGTILCPNVFSLPGFGVNQKNNTHKRSVVENSVKKISKRLPRVG